MKNLVFVLMVGLLLSGCASLIGDDEKVASGGAIYHFKKTGNDCEASVTSSREVGEAEVTISECDMTVSTSSLGGADEAMRTINTLINLLMERRP